METLEKEAADRAPYGVSYVGELPAGDPIAASTWSPDLGITLDGATHSGVGQTTSVWVQGGVPGGQYIVRNDITSQAGRKLQRQFRVVITDDA